MFNFRRSRAVDGDAKDEPGPVTTEVTETTKSSETASRDVGITLNGDKTTVNDVKLQTDDDNRCSRLRSGTNDAVLWLYTMYLVPCTERDVR